MKITNDIQSEIYQRLISSYPELSDLHPSSFSQILGGADTSIFAFDLHRDSVTVPLILRIHRPEHSGSARREYQIMKGLYSAGLDIPRPYILLERLSTLDRACIVMERIQGQLLSEEVLASYPGSRSDRLIREYMKTMARLHSIDWAQHLPFLDSNGVNTDPQLSVDYDLSRPRRLLRRYDINELTQVVGWLEDNEVKIPRACLIHGDYHAMNIMVTNDSRLITIDWTNARLGDFRIDLGFAVVAACSSGLNIRKQMVSEYESATRGSVEDLDYFIVLSTLNNVFRIYSAIFDHRITGESDETAHLFRSEYSDYSRYIVTTTQEITGVSLARILDRIE